VFGKGKCGEPRVVVRVANKPSPDWVVEHVGNRLLEVVLGVDYPGREPSAEQVTAALVPIVETPRVLPVEVLDSRRKSRLRRFENQVDVVVHQAESMAVPAVAFDGFGEQAEIGDPIVVVAKDRGAVDPARSHVKVAVREVRPKDARHRPRGYEVTAASAGDRDR
jgi:hypothetical protein